MGISTMRCRFLLYALCGLALSALAGVPAHAADIAAGKETAELCVGCHGEAGISQTENIPSLAGQPDQFIQWQLAFFPTATPHSHKPQPVPHQTSNNKILT